MKLFRISEVFQLLLIFVLRFDCNTQIYKLFRATHFPKHGKRHCNNSIYKLAS